MLYSKEVMLSRKVFISILVVGILGSAGAGAYFWSEVSQKTNTSDVSAGTPPAPLPEEVLEWKDQAGFSFEYPKGLKSDIHEEDQENYAHIEFTQSDHPGRIIVWAKDLPAQAGMTVDSWVKNEKTLTAGTVFDTTFADIDGKKVLLTTPDKKIITAVVDDAIVFYVEGIFEDSDYWTKAYDTVVSTFAFIPFGPEPLQASQTGADAMAFDEEEVLE